MFTYQKVGIGVAALALGLSATVGGAGAMTIDHSVAQPAGESLSVAAGTGATAIAPDAKPRKHPKHAKPGKHKRPGANKRTGAGAPASTGNPPSPAISGQLSGLLPSLNGYIPAPPAGR